MVGLALAADLYYDRSRIRQAEATRLESLSSYVTENLVRQIGAVNNALEGAGAQYQESILFQGDMRDTQRLALLTRAMPSVQALTIFDANGVAVAADRPAQVGVSNFDAEYFALPRARPDAHTLYLSRPAIADRTVAMYLSRPILDKNNHFFGVASATLDQDFFRLVVRSALSSPDMRVSLAHFDGELFLSVPPVPTDRVINVATPGSAFLEHVNSGKPMTVYEGLIAITGLSRLVVFNTVNPKALGMNKPIVFSVSRSTEAIYAPWLARAWRYSVLYCVAIIMAVAAVTWETRRQVRVAGVKRQAKDVLALSAARLELALDGADLGLWELELDSGQMNVDARGASMLGYGVQALVKTVDGWNGTLHPSDVEANTQAFKLHLRGKTEAYQNEFRSRRPDGEYVWLFARGKVTLRDAADRPIRVIGTFMNITARKVAEDTLAQAAMLLRQTGEIAKIGGWTLDVATQKTSWTEEVYRIHGLEIADAPDLTQALLFYKQEWRPVISAAVQSGLEHGTPWDLELEILSATGRELWVRAIGEAVYQDGCVVRLAGTFQDITERKRTALQLEQLNVTLAELSYTDALTGLGNRRLFDDSLRSEWGRAAREGSTLSLLMIDIDYFKRYNDLHGHQQGDLCLQQAAAVMRDSLRRSHERAMRYGGEEFAILLPQTDLAGAELVAARLLDAMQTATMSHGASPLGPWVTLSIGVACLRPPSEGAAADLLRRADEALYNAKGNGRARYACWTDTKAEAPSAL